MVEDWYNDSKLNVHNCGTTYMADTIRHGKNWLYIDAENRRWIISKESVLKLNRRNGEYTWWEANCGNLYVGRERNKRDIVKQLKDQYGTNKKVKELSKKLSIYLVH